MKKNTKNILIVVAAVAILLFGWQVVRRIILASAGSGGPRGAVPVAVEVQPVVKDTIRNFGNFTGSLMSRAQYVLSPKISGKLNRLYVNIGDRVSQGQLVAQLDDEEYRQQSIQAQADLQVARANLDETRTAMEVAERELERIKQLHARGISADSELDAAKGTFASQEARFKVAQAQVANREAAYNAAQLRLSYTQIRATWEGGSSHRVVGERFANEGVLLTVNAPVLSILEIDPLIAVIHVSDKDYFKVKVGQKASISTDAVVGETVQGQIARIAPMLQETSREARIEIEFANPKEIFKPGMFINAVIEFETHENATVVPVSSVVKRNDREGIFLADTAGDKALFVPVTVGIVSGEMAEIIEPDPLEGRVVVLGQHLLVPDSPIMISNESPQGGGADAKTPPPNSGDGRSETGERP
jgi:RND family efflux transporter MFP subunit